MTSELEMMKQENENLKKELKKAQDYVEFIENKRVMQLKTQKIGLVEQLTKDLELDLDGLRDIAECLPEKAQSMILRRISMIESTLAKLED